MITIGEVNIFIDDINYMTFLASGRTIKEVLINYYKYEQKKCETFNRCINDYTAFKILVKSIDELRYILNFLESVELVEEQSVELRTVDISVNEILDTINLYDNKELFSKIYIKIDNPDWIDLNTYKKFANELNRIKSLIPSNSSPLEIIKYVYDIVKSRRYKNDPEDEKSLLSRNLSSTLLGEYIVCAGFTKIFNAILREFDINCTEYHFKLQNNNAHCISVVNIKDDKYGIDGLYFFDPSADSYIENEKNETKYAHFMKTIDDYKSPILEKDNFNSFNKEDHDIERLKLYIESFKRSGNIHYENIFENEKFKKTLEEVLNFIQIDSDLFNGDAIYLAASDNAMMERAALYEYIIYLKSKFGEDVSHDKFIKLLIETGADYIFAVNACVSKFSILTDDDVNYLNEINKTKRK